MNALREYNKYVLKRCYNFTKEQDLATPLLVSSSQDYLNGLNRRILYIGQETNGWLNYSDKEFMPEVEEVEQGYLRFLDERGANNKDFWMFIRKCLEISKEELSNNVVWNNTIIASKRVGLGHPVMTDELRQTSIEYLTYLHNYFKPEYTIFVNGPCNPYYSMTTELLETFDSSLAGDYPTKSNPVLIDDQKGIIWTYHPNYLNKSHLKDDVIGKIKKKIL